MGASEQGRARETPRTSADRRWRERRRQCHAKGRSSNTPLSSSAPQTNGSLTPLPPGSNHQLEPWRRKKDGFVRPAGTRGCIASSTGQPESLRAAHTAHAALLPVTRPARTSQSPPGSPQHQPAADCPAMSAPAPLPRRPEPDLPSKALCCAARTPHGRCSGVCGRPGAGASGLPAASDDTSP